MASPGDPRSPSPAIMEDLDLLNDLNFNNPYSMDLADADSAAISTAKLFVSDVGALPQNHHQEMSPPDSDPESSTESTSPSNSGAGTRQSPSGTPPQQASIGPDSMAIDNLDDSSLDWNQETYIFGQQDSSKMHDASIMSDDVFNFSAFDSSSNAATNSQNSASITAAQPPSLPAQSTSHKRSRSQGAGLATACSSSPSAFYGNPITNPMASMQWLHGQNMGFQAPSQFSLGLLPMAGIAVAPFPLQQQSPQQQSEQQKQLATKLQPTTSGRFPYNLVIHPAPSKSRVETQLNIVISMDRLPERVTKLHLPTHSISKPKLLSKPSYIPQPESLELYCMVVCTSVVKNADILRKVLLRAAASGHPDIRDPNTAFAENDENHPKNGGEVHICSGCIQRERKRAARKKNKSVEDDELWSTNETRRIVVFNTFEVIEWSKMEESEHQGRWQAVIPMRIACYCRHHGEKEGFRVIMTVKDHMGNVLAQTMTENIMITDDHKTHPVETSDPNKAALRAATRVRQTRLRQPGNSRKSISGPPAAKSRPRRGSDDKVDLKPAISEDPEEPSTKRRKSSGSPKLPMTMAMTPIDTSQAQAQAQTQPQAHLQSHVQAQAVIAPLAPLAANISAPAVSGPAIATPITSHRSSVSPFTPAMQLPYGTDNLTSPVQGLPMHGLSVQSPINDHSLFSPDSQVGTLDAINMLQFSNSTSSSARQSRDPSPGLMQTTRPSLHTSHGMMGMTPVAPQATHPYIQKVVPAEGSKCGGSEVTVLGVGFRPGMRVMFGDRESTTTNFWGENTLLCRSPPSRSAGVVRVTVAPEVGIQVPHPQNPQAIFKYLDDDGEQLIRMALTILNHKMNGKMEDADSVARRVFNSAGSGLESSDNGNSRHTSNSGGVSYNLNISDTEAMVMKCLENIDLCTSIHIPQFDLKGPSGQTMLHLSSSLGFDRVVAGLLARGANPNTRDKAGYTPLHLAALNNHVEIVRRLIVNRADVMIESGTGYRAADLTSEGEISDVLSPQSQLRRSVSDLNLSIASSEDSIESLPRMLITQGNSPSENPAEQSPEYSSFEDDEFYASSLNLDVNEADVEDGQAQISSNTVAATATRLNTRDLQGGSASTDSDGQERQAPDSPGVAAQLTAQLQQLQQTMAEHLPALMQFRNLTNLPNLPHLPNLPQIPGFPADYQAMRRLGQYLTLSGQRPEATGTVGDQQSTARQNSPDAPPAYDEIFPGGDTKAPRSAEEAAARLALQINAAKESRPATIASMEISKEQEVEIEEIPINADDEQNELATNGKNSDVLTIGPKNAITKEQQMSFLRVYHAKNTGLGADRNLWLVWIPLLVLMIFAMFATTYPHTVGRLWASALDYFGVPQDSMARDLGLPVANMLALTKLSDVLGTAVAAATSSQATPAAAVEEAAAGSVDKFKGSDATGGSSQTDDRVVAVPDNLQHHAVGVVA
ncbi:SPT3 Dosage dependent suppressor of Ty-induced promoter mutations-like protein [Ceratocystis pirilliformis]|uniref:SPT3 Dosage dependent suppressor of Ty-induced promoter mutations-like protein n=1 Tax=Ceratocystis pirilliformis TaxID=259994 RepID=A0ABR3YIP5_9PEZI